MEQASDPAADGLVDRFGRRITYVRLSAAAALYSTVGHGGASAYLAIMALFALAPETMRPTAT